jgi:hypothetical protein
MHATLRMSRLVWLSVREHVLGSREERMAYLLARGGRWPDPAGVPVFDLLVTSALLVPDSALVVQTGVRVEIDPLFTREVLIACYESGMSLVDVHTHPFSTDTVSFSGHDVANMRATHADFLARMPDTPPVGVASLVLGQSSVAGVITDPGSETPHPLERFVLLDDAMTEVPLCQSLCHAS